MCVCVCISIYVYESESEVTQSCLTLCDAMDCSLPIFSIHGIFQARVLEWVAISFSRGSSGSTQGSNPGLPCCRQMILPSELPGMSNICVHTYTHIPWRGHGSPLQYSCLENLMDRGAWWATVHGVAKSQTWLKQLSKHTCIHIYTVVHIYEPHGCTPETNTTLQTSYTSI